MKLTKKALLISLVILLVGLSLFFLYKTNSVKTSEVISPVSLPKIAIFSDIHTDYQNLAKAGQMAKGKQVEFVIILGDLTNSGTKSELEKIKSKLDADGLKYYVIPGNHDLYSSRQQKQDLWSPVFGPKYQTITLAGNKYLLVNNADDFLGIDASQWSWLIQELKDCPKITCYVLLHEPLNHPSSDHVMGELKPGVASQGAQLIKMLVDYQVKEVFAGHLHRSTSYEIDNLKTTIVGAVTVKKNFQKPRFLLLEGTDKKEMVIAD